MAFQRGEVVLIPFPYTDLSVTKTRPAVVVSSARYHAVRPDLLLAYLSSQIQQADPDLDYVLADWQAANLLKPSFVRPKLAAIEPSSIVHQVGTLSPADMVEVDRRLQRALDLNKAVLAEALTTTDLVSQSAATVQALAVEALKAAVSLGEAGHQEIDLGVLRQLLGRTDAFSLPLA